MVRSERGESRGCRSRRASQVTLRAVLGEMGHKHGSSKSTYPSGGLWILNQFTVQVLT